MARPESPVPTSWRWRRSLVPARTFVEIDITFPRRLLADTGAFIGQPGNGLQSVVDREKQTFSSPFGPGPGTGDEAGRRRGRRASWGWLWFLLLPLILVSRLFGFGRSGRGSQPRLRRLRRLVRRRGREGGGGGGGGGAWSSGRPPRVVRGLETGKRHPGKREDDDLEGDRREDGDIIRNDAGEAEHDRHAEDDAPTGEQRGREDESERGSVHQPCGYVARARAPRRRRAAGRSRARAER